jgi:predicted CXXCH cytochrome family protein
MKELVYASAAILLLAAFTLVANLSDGHLMSANCQSCHLATGDFDAEQARILIDSQERLCSQCHSNAVIASHPSGFVPSVDEIQGYQLDWKGELTCSTCHDIHGMSQGLLVNELSGKEFCLSCHQESFFEQMKDGGLSVFVSGHTASDDSGDFLLNIDAFSAKCLECHSGRSDSLDVSYNNGNISHSGGRVNHPIGKDYQAAFNYGGYRPVAQLDTRIVLPSGLVSCISCHQAYDQVHGNAVLSNQGSALCYQCHDI